MNGTVRLTQKEIQEVRRNVDNDQINQTLPALVVEGKGSRSKGVHEGVGTAVPYEHRSATGVTVHAAEQLADRGITVEDAQMYVDTALVMFEQDRNSFLYISPHGAAVIGEPSGRFVTAWSSSVYREGYTQILEVILHDYFSKR